MSVNLVGVARLLVGLSSAYKDGSSISCSFNGCVVEVLSCTCLRFVSCAAIDFKEQA